MSYGERAIVKSGDIIELISGSYYFKYVILSEWRNLATVSKGVEGDSKCIKVEGGKKRIREEFNFGVFVGYLLVFFILFYVFEFFFVLFYLLVLYMFMCNFLVLIYVNVSNVGFF